MKQKLTTSDFVRRAIAVHGTRYNYDKVSYVGYHDKVIITCPKHGDFQQNPSDHLQGKNCSKCTGNVKTTEDFISGAREVHGDYYDYSLTEYVSSKHKVKIICPKHGEFEQGPSNHTHGFGCIQCGREGKPMLRTEFLRRAVERHGAKYLYISDMFTKSSDKVKIICPSHGPFEILASSHIGKRGRGCYQCGRESSGKSRVLDLNTWIDRFTEFHGSKYDYSLVEYRGNSVPVKIICPEHGVFEQRPNDHIRYGCRQCARQNPKMQLDLFSYIVSAISNHDVQMDARPFGFELDIYIPDLNLALEFNGLYWHSTAYREEVAKKRHKVKTDRCRENGIRLIHIWEDDWVYRQDVVKKFLTNILLQNTERTFARKVNLTRIGYDEAKPFLDQNHIQGAVGATYHVGGYLNDVLVSVTSFKQRKDMTYELVRHSTSIKIVGILAKASQYALRIFADKIVSFCDLSMYTGQSYELAGYTLESTLPPDYKYVVRDRREHKFGFRHKQLKTKLPNYDPTLTEWENCRNHGIYRIYDCGKAKYVLTRQ